MRASALSWCLSRARRVGAAVHPGSSEGGWSARLLTAPGTLMAAGYSKGLSRPDLLEAIGGIFPNRTIIHSVRSKTLGHSEVQPHGRRDGMRLEIGGIREITYYGDPEQTLWQPPVHSWLPTLRGLKAAGEIKVIAVDRAGCRRESTACMSGSCARQPLSLRNGWAPLSASGPGGAWPLRDVAARDSLLWVDRMDASKAL